jgi:hypothetical protein
VHIGKHFSDIIPVQNGFQMKRYFTLEYADKKIQENQERLKLIGTCQLLVYAAGINFIGKNINTIKINAGTLLLAFSKRISMEVNAEKIKCCSCLITRMQDKTKA